MLIFLLTKRKMFGILAEVSRKMLYTFAFFVLVLPERFVMEEQRKTKKSEPVDWLREALTLARYLDFYGALFDERQRSIFEDYVCNDMSLSEIAEREGMTRQGVSDLVRRTSGKLHEYENCLHLSERAEKAERTLSEISERIAAFADSEREELERLCRQLAETL